MAIAPSGEAFGSQYVIAGQLHRELGPFRPLRRIRTVTKVLLADVAALIMFGQVFQFDGGQGR